MENFRRAIGLRIKEVKEVYEGEVGCGSRGYSSRWNTSGVGVVHTVGLRSLRVVAKVTEMTPAETENPVGGYGKTIEHVILGLKTTKGTKQLKLVRLCFGRNPTSTNSFAD